MSIPETCELVIRNASEHRTDAFRANDTEAMNRWSDLITAAEQLRADYENFMRRMLESPADAKKSFNQFQAFETRRDRITENYAETLEVLLISPALRRGLKSP